MLTLAFAQIAWSVAFQWIGVTGGDNGMLGVWPERLGADAGAFLLAVARARRALGVGAAARDRCSRRSAMRCARCAIPRCAREAIGIDGERDAMGGAS